MKEFEQVVLALWQERERLRGVKPSVEELLGIKNRFPLMFSEKDFLDSLEKGKGLLQNELRKYREEMEKQTGKKLSRPALCADHLLVLSANVSHLALACREEENIPGFIAFHDISIGISNIASSLLSAEEEIAEDSDRNIIGAIDEVADWMSTPMSTGERAERYLTIKRRDQNLMPLLIKDPSGFLLVESVVGQLKEKFNQPKSPEPTFLIPEFVIAGAELATKTYKTLYPLTEEL